MGDIIQINCNSCNNNKDFFIANEVNLFLVLNFCPTICPTILPQVESDSKEQFEYQIVVSCCNYKIIYYNF